jgi:photosystem II stability/assembly factor-like uncharacterized protein
MKIILLFILFLISFNSPFSQWYSKNNGLPGEWSLGSVIDALDEQSAVISVSNDIYFTSDGGSRWELVSTPDEIIGHNIIDLTAVDRNKIWICTQLDDPLGACIYATINGGATWVKQFDNPLLTDFLNYIEMFDSMNGIAMGDRPFSQPDSPVLILKTTDGGTNWISMNQTYLLGAWSGDLWRRIDFVSPHVGYFFESGINPQKLFKTLDGGITWIETNFSDYAAVIKFYDELKGAAANSQGDIFLTSDGGDTWRAESIEGVGWPDDIEFAPGDPNKIWLLSDNSLFISSDGGYTWLETFVSYELDGIDIEFVSDNCGWLLSKDNIYYTTNGSSVITSVRNQKLPEEFHLYQNYPNPFNPTTIIKFTIPSGEQRAHSVKLMVYDILGNEVAVLLDETKNPGTYEVAFDGTARDGNPLASGIYFYKLTAGNFTFTKKMTLIR